MEAVDEFREILFEEFQIENVDWLDVDKQRSPFFYLDPATAIGQFVVFKDKDGRAEMWVRTAPGGKAFYSRPLTLECHTADTDIETLGLEIFDLANVLTQDYQAPVRV